MNIYYRLERQIQKKENHLWSLRWEVRDLESEKIRFASPACMLHVDH